MTEQQRLCLQKQKQSTQVLPREELISPADYTVGLRLHYITYTEENEALGHSTKVDDGKSIADIVYDLGNAKD